MSNKVSLLLDINDDYKLIKTVRIVCMYVCMHARMYACMCVCIIDCFWNFRTGFARMTNIKKVVG